MKKTIDSLILLRIPFSIYLMPIYWFSLSNLNEIDPLRALAVFAIFHLFVYPASNGYNSYFDRDTSSIGGLENPPEVNSHLFKIVVVFDLLSICCSYLISPIFSALVLVYMIVSKAYSFKKIRLKKYPFLGAASVVIFQGAFTFLTIQYGVGITETDLISSSNLSLALVSTLFLLGSYPLTQVYQHEEDKLHEDNTLSRVLGLRGTFLFSAILFMIATTVLVVVYYFSNQYVNIGIYLGMGIPVIVAFYRWQKKVSNDLNEADFANTMLMNKMSSLCMSAAFIIMIVVTGSG
ncbi:MAG: prenyltransferase [Bacteroidetes bacterium]|nr:MAG: prenyltransferase [Bacteroidota bacterium]